MDTFTGCILQKDGSLRSYKHDVIRQNYVHNIRLEG